MPCLRRPRTDDQSVGKKRAGGRGGTKQGIGRRSKLGGEDWGRTYESETGAHEHAAVAFSLVGGVGCEDEEEPAVGDHLWGLFRVIVGVE